MVSLHQYGSTALITGASSGIGEEFAKQFALQEMNLILVARRENKLKELSDRLTKKHPISTTVISQDLTTRYAADQVYEKTKELGLEVDILVNNAGVGTIGEFSSLDLNRELQMVDLNCRLPVALTHHFLPAMKKRGRGAIIIVSSVLGQITAPYMTTYSATKAFDLVFAEGLYSELKGSGIDVLGLMPGYTATGFQEAAEIKSDFPVFARTPRQVVKTALEAIGKQASVIDGPPNKIGAIFAKMIPREWILATNAKMMKIGI